MNKTDVSWAKARKRSTLQAKFNYGLELHRQGKLADAELIYEEILRRQPKHFDALHMLGAISIQKGQRERGVELISRAIGLNPKVANSYNNLGKALWDLKRHDDALVSFDRAIALKPDYAVAYSNRGNPLLDLKRPAEALASYDKAIALKPDYAEAYSNRGNALLALKRPAEALASYEKAIALKPDYVEAHRNRGSVLSKLRRYDRAIASYETALSLNPDSIGTEGDRFNAKMRICDWRHFDTDCARVVTRTRNGITSTAPFAYLAISSNSDDQLQCARLWVAHKHPSQLSLSRSKQYDHKRIRLAYLSPDFREHPLSYLMVGIFERHNRSCFDVSAISLQSDPDSEIRMRLKASFDHFVEGENYSDDQLAALIKELEIDILVDLAGFTEDSRTGILARRPAPIQVNYLGYPGTMGAEYIDYVIADQTVIPENQYVSYSEKIVLLPHSYYPTSYQVNDAKRSIAGRAFERAELGLPSKGFVFCCFNNNYKITPHVFDCWMRILKQVDGSVLWLLEDNAEAGFNLRKEARARGVAAERLIFANRMPLPDHLARHRSADLFLDTLPYNAHTTASDALWAGLPVLTCLGKTFAGRVAASLLNAIGLPELITKTPEAYEQTAIHLATHLKDLAVIKQKLNENRHTTPLFDTKLFTKHIEAAYTAMYQRHQDGLPPDHIVIQN